jgi:F-type H+-transporting ATPase subunit b
MEIHIPDMIWAIINFLVLVAILNKFLYKPLLGHLEARKQEIQNKYDEAEAARAQAQQMKEEYMKEMQNAKREAQEIIAKATKLGEDTRTEIITEAREEAAKLSKKAQEEIRLAKEKAKAELRDEVAALAILAAGKIIDKNLMQEDHEKMVRDFLNEVGDAS